jgi:hypothetical protein
MFHVAYNFIETSTKTYKSMKGEKHISTKSKGEVIVNYKFWQDVKYGFTLIVMHLIIFKSVQEIHPWHMQLTCTTSMA